MNIQVIDYNLSNFKEDTDHLEIIDALYYPTYLFEIDIAIKRKVGPPRIVKQFVTIDLVRNRAMLSNCVPETRMEEVDSKKVLPMLVSQEDALTLAKKKVLKSILTKVITFYAPEYSVVNCVQAYKEFVFFEERGTMKFLDTVMGHTQEVSEHIQ